MGIILRDYAEADGPGVNEVAKAAWQQFRPHYSDEGWRGISSFVSELSTLSADGEMIVAEADGGIIGCVTYIGPGRPKHDFFDATWAVMRMLVVAPEARGKGAGRALAEECLKRGLRDGADMFALHTTPMMADALALYGRMGFIFLRPTPDIYGIPYGVYLKTVLRPWPAKP